MIGSTVGQYRITFKLGAGWMGETDKAVAALNKAMSI